MKKFENLKVGIPVIIIQNKLFDGVYYDNENLPRIRRLFDFIIDLANLEHYFDSVMNDTNFFTFDSHLNLLSIYHNLNPGGYLLTCNFLDEMLSPITKVLQSQHLWKSNQNSSYFYKSPIFSCSKIQFLGLKKRSICVNTRAALYWGADGTSNDEKIINQLKHERDLLEEITITQSVQHTANYFVYGQNNTNKKSSPIDPDNPFLRMTPEVRNKAIQALDHHGVCIIKNLFPPEVIKNWGDAALLDLDLASLQLKTTKGLLYLFIIIIYLLYLFI